MFIKVGRTILFLFLYTIRSVYAQDDMVRTDVQKVVSSCLPLMMYEDTFDFEHIKKKIKEIDPEEVIFQVAQNGISDKKFYRKGLLVKKKHARGTVIICHGYLGCKRDAIALKHLFPHYNVFCFDFRAHGDLIEGQVSTIGRDEAYDVIGAVNFIKSDASMADKPVIAYGYSMGAVSAIEAQAKDATLFDAMILDCPYDSTDHAMRRGLEEKMKINVLGKDLYLPGKEFILAHMYDDIAQVITSYLFEKITALNAQVVATKFTRVTPIESIKKINIPCLFIHCDRDQKVPTHAVESLYANKKGCKALWITLGKGHFGSYHHDPEMYWYRINKFLHTVLLSHNVDQYIEKIYDYRKK